MKFYFKYFFLGIIIVLAFNYKVFLGDGNLDENSGVTETIYIAEIGTIKESIEVVGSAELVDEQSLGFNIAGTITKVNVKAGDSVKKGDVIAEIDNTDALNTIQDARISLENAQINLQELYKGPDESNILQSQNSITSAENALISSRNSLATAQKELENLKVSQENAKTKALEDIENQKKELESSKKSLELAEKDLEILVKEKTQSLSNTTSSKTTTIKNTEDSFKTYLAEIDKIITEADYVLGVTDANAKRNDSYEIYLGAKNTSYKNEAAVLLNQSISALNSLRTLVNNYDYSGDRDKIISILQNFSSTYNELHNMADALYRTAENSISSAGIFTESDIESIKNSMSGYRSTALSKVTSITSTINTLNTLSDIDLLNESNQNAIASKEESIKSQELSISKQELSITNAVKSYEELLASQKVSLASKENDVESKEKDVASKEKSLEISNISYKELLEGPTKENISKANNSIRQAQIKLDNATKNLDDYMLTAPFDGIVRTVDYMVGDNLKNDTNKYIYIENPDLIEITVKLDQVDVVNVEVGNDAEITFDAYTKNPAKAKISLIDTTPVSTSGVISYQVKLVLDDENFDKRILSGMTANVEIITNQKENVLTLKIQAIKEREGKSYVTIEENGTRREVEVETGFSANGDTEIISGLNEGDRIVSQTFTVTAGTSSNTNNIQVGGIGGGMGGGMGGGTFRTGPGGGG